MDFQLPDSGWERLARREPYFAVLTAPEFLRANLTPDREREFFDSGEHYVDWTLRVIDEHLAPEFAPMSTLEYGCGVGRLAVAFARRPGNVTAVDRSPAMLDAARREAARRGAGHITFQTPGGLFASSSRPRFDLVSCYGVLQRLPPADGLALVRLLLPLIAPGGVGVFHVPFRSTSSRLVEWSRRIRLSVPGVNAVANLIRGKPASDPFVPSHTYDLDDVFRELQDASIAGTHVVFEQQAGFAAAIVFAQAPASGMRRGDAAVRAGVRAPVSARAAGLADAAAAIDVRQMIANTSIDELNRTAEAYFSSLTDWDHHLAKPFNEPDETATLLVDVATLLQGLRLTPGTRVLEFGAGTGWLSRFLTQLGCEVTLLDVSPTALRIARELYDRLPIVGARPAPRFLAFDGRRIDLPDASVDRILSFHAFHHATNPDAIVREFSRVLRPGGIVAFAEPGPRHAERPQSQFEMRTYGVVENNVDVHAIWRDARASGFTDMKLAAYHAPQFLVSLGEYADLLAGGPTLERWDDSTRGFLRHVRNFFLYKGGGDPADSRTTAGLRCTIQARLVGAAVDRPLVIEATVTNTGQAIWLPSDADVGGVGAGVHLYDAAGGLVTFDFAWQRLTEPPRAVLPGERVTCHVTLPPLDRGRHVLEVDCVSSRVSWFAQLGSAVARIDVDIV